jgi:uncharacterized protein Yka (UPF0111/DUF47 family)
MLKRRKKEVDKKERKRLLKVVTSKVISFSRPDLANLARELSKCMDAVSHAAYKEMLRVIQFVVGTKQYCSIVLRCSQLKKEKTGI